MSGSIRDFLDAVMAGSLEGHDRQDVKVDVIVAWPEIASVKILAKGETALATFLSETVQEQLNDKAPFLAERDKLEPKGSTWTVIDTTKLEPGDIIFSTAKNWANVAIRLATWSRQSHAAIHIGGGFLIEAVKLGVRKVHARCFAFRSDKFVRVYRLKQRPEASAMEQATRIARRLVYRPYATWDAITSVTPRLRTSDHHGRFCSQLVAESYSNAGIKLVDIQPSKVTPAMLLGSPEIEDVSKSVLRRISRQSWADVIATLVPRGFSTPSWPSFDRWCSSESFENVVFSLGYARLNHLGLSRRLRRTYNYFDLLKFLDENSADKEVRAFDHELSAVMSAISDRFWVVPKGLVDGLIARPIMWDLTSAHLREDAQAEMKRLLRELQRGSEWNETDLTEARDELRAAAERSDSPSISIAAGMAMRDWTNTTGEYRMLNLHVQDKSS